MNTSQNYDQAKPFASAPRVIAVAELSEKLMFSLEHLEKLFGADLLEPVLSYWLTEHIKDMGENATTKERFNIVCIHNLFMESVKTALAIRQQVTTAQN